MSAVVPHDNGKSLDKFSHLPPFSILCISRLFLIVSYLVYEITSVIKKSISGELNLDIPKDFPIQHLGRFLKESTDLTEYNNGNGMSFYEIDALIRRNREELLRAFEDENEDFLQTILHRIRQDLTAPDGEGGDPTKKIFLTHHRSIQREVACVYTVVKDTYVSILEANLCDRHTL